jgi:hypothetical protein
MAPAKALRGGDGAQTRNKEPKGEMKERASESLYRDPAGTVPSGKV